MNLEPYLALLQQNKSQKKHGQEVKLTVADLKQLDPKKLFHGSVGVRRAAIRELIEGNYVGKLRILVELLTAEPELSLKYEIRKGLNEIQSGEELWEMDISENTRKLLDALRSEDPHRIQKAAHYIAKNKLTDLLPKTTELEKSQDLPSKVKVHLKKTNIFLLQCMGTVSSSAIAEYLNEEEPLLICKAIEALALVGGNRYIRKILTYLTDPNQKIAGTALASLSVINAERMDEILRGLATSVNESNRQLFLSACESLNYKRLSSLLDTLLRDEVKEIRDQSMALIQKFNVNSRLSSEPTPQSDNDSESDIEEIKLRSQSQSASKAQTALVLKRLKSETNPKKISRLLQVLKMLPGYEKKKLGLYMRFLTHADDSVRASAIQFMISFIPVGHMDFFIPYLDDPHHLVRGKAIVALSFDDKIFKANEAKIRESLSILANDRRTSCKLTAVDCLGVMQNIDFIEDCLKLASCGILEVETRMKSFMSSWAKVDKEVRAKIHQWLIKNKGFDHETSATHNNVSSDLESRIRKIMQEADDRVKIKFLKSLAQRNQDFVVVEILLPYLKEEKSSNVLAELLITLNALGCEDAYYHFQGFLRSSDSLLVYTAVKCLIHEHTFRVLPLVQDLINNGDFEMQHWAEIIAVAMPYIVDEQRQLALRGMQLLVKQQAPECFAICLDAWTEPVMLLIKESQNLICSTKNTNIFNQCAHYLVSNLETSDLLEKVDLMLTKVSHKDIFGRLHDLKTELQSKT